MRTFEARYDSECAGCFGLIVQGDTVGWVDDEVVCDDCWPEPPTPHEVTLDDV